MANSHYSRTEQTKGFSLVELLVVISIIGLVTGVGASFVSSVQRNTRDAQREADLRVLQSALQQYYADNNFYPDSLNLRSGDQFTSCTGNSKPCVTPKKYLSALPKDPQDSTAQYYLYKAFISSAVGAQECTSSFNQGKCHFYQLCANLENPVTIATCSYGNFAVTPL